MRLYSLLVVVGVVSFIDAGKPAVQDQKGERVTLLGILGEWQYPGSKMLDGATMQDGGNPALPSTFCHSVLTTPDSVEKVVAFYTDKTTNKNPNATPTPKKRLKGLDGGCVLVQDDSKNRPTALKVIVVTKADSTTTLVISRAGGEAATHIAWTHHFRHNLGR
jgi:hypothetical protein